MTFHAVMMRNTTAASTIIILRSQLRMFFVKSVYLSVLRVHYTSLYMTFHAVMPRNTTAASTIIILRELFAKYGMPVHCVSDNGPQFRSEEFARFLKMNAVKYARGTPYHAASNGLAERMVQSFRTT